MVREPNPWVGVDRHYGADDEDICPYCGDEPLADAEEMCETCQMFADEKENENA